MLPVNWWHFAVSVGSGLSAEPLEWRACSFKAVTQRPGSDRDMARVGVQAASRGGRELQLQAASRGECELHVMQPEEQKQMRVPVVAREGCHCLSTQSVCRAQLS